MILAAGVVMPLEKYKVRPHLKRCAVFRSPHLKMDIAGFGKGVEKDNQNDPEAGTPPLMGPRLTFGAFPF